jgi:DDB1- and CUL4-associated factor 13
VIIAAYTLFALRLRYLTEEKRWIFPFTVLGPPSLVFGVHDLRSVWEWEVAAGHYPSARDCKETHQLMSIYWSNTCHAVPPYMQSLTLINPARPSEVPGTAGTMGVGSSRVYGSPEVDSHFGTYPPRPVPGSAADMDRIMQHCDYSSGKVSYVLFVPVPKRDLTLSLVRS